MPRERSSLVGNSLLQVTITNQGIYFMRYRRKISCIETLCRHFSSQCHTNTIGNPLPQRSGGYFDTRGVPEFRVTGSLAPPLTKALQLIHWQIKSKKVE